MGTGVTKEVDFVRDLNVEVLSPLTVSAENSKGLRELSLGNIFVSIADDTIENTAVETNFAPTGVGSATIAANSLAVGQRYILRASGILSTV